MIAVRWYSPLDSAQTEIARYSQAILPTLEERFCVELACDGEKSGDELEFGKQTSGMEPINVYNIGNSHLHCSILDLALKHPGIVILHDVSLFELGLAYARKNSDFDLREVIINEHGFHAAKAFDKIFGGSAYEWRGHSQSDYDGFVKLYPLFQSFLGNALGVVVHSDYARKRVEKVYSGPLTKLELPYAVPAAGLVRRAKEDSCQIVFCGHAGPNRRLKQFIEAWSEISQPSHFCLSLYGAIDKADEILALADDLGLSGLVDVVGFVDEEQLDDALSAAHLAVNLRNPTMGETSASQLRYWSRGLASIVSDVGWYSELPNDVVMKVSTRNEKRDIISVLESVIRGEPSHLRYGTNGYNHLLQEHGIERYVHCLREFVGTIEENRLYKSEVEERLVGLFSSMCSEADDSLLFENVLDKIAETFDREKQVEIDS